MDKISKIYCDFDGTITKKDAVNTFFELYADEKWQESEALWVEGKISSMKNAITQVALLKNMSQKTLDDYIDSIEIDDYFCEFVRFIESKGIELIILSDGFDLFIEKILQKFGIKNVKFYANHLVFDGKSFKIEFPYHNKSCDKGAGMCKCDKIKEKSFCYIGDGTSDLCVAQKAGILFASKTLNEYCKNSNIRHYPFKSFQDIIKKLKETIC